MRRGVVRWTTVPLRGSAPKLRPMVIVSDDAFNLRRYPVVALLGPRQVGKTTLGRSLRESLDAPFTYFDRVSIERACARLR